MKARTILRSRWVRLAFLAAMVCVVAVGLRGYLSSKPLSPLEEQMIGTWETPGPPKVVFNFFPDRTVVHECHNVFAMNGRPVPPNVFRWTWRIEGSTLFLRETPEMSLNYLIGQIESGGVDSHSFNISSLERGELALAGQHFKRAAEGTVQGR